MLSAPGVVQPAQVSFKSHPGAAGRVAISLVTELEVGFSARSTKHFDRTREDVIGPLYPGALIRILFVFDPWRSAIAVNYSRSRGAPRSLEISPSSASL